MSHIPYAKVPIIHQGLRQEETIVQITVALDYLEKVSHGIFEHIKTSVENQKSHLARLRERSKTVQAKMNKLAGTNKATKVFASAKYPGSDVPRDYVSALLSNPLPPIDRAVVRITSKHPPYDPNCLKEKTQHVHIKMSSRQVRKNVEVTPEEGLGSLPSDLDSVSALILFNTSENLYKKYVMLDPLGLVTKTRQIIEDEVKGDLDAAPRSMCQEMVNFKPGENYFYSPTLQEVPQLDVPLDLPDLPGIAGDLQFSMDSGPPIAPSGSTPIPDLPVVFTETPSETILPTPPPPPPVASPPAPLPVHSTPPPPPPPPPPSEIPPPPAISQSTSPPQSADVLTPSQTTNNAITRGDDARANLMEAIRNAGGKGKAKLRSVVDRKQEAKRIKQEEDIIHKSSGGNLMADLHAKLSLRRKGISGSQPGTADPLEKMLAMIPPPPVKESDTDEQDDADWED
ncbi:WASH complex subunit 1-like isoform X2 [Homalodisca vitripennis]|nr:WASH complex subunit 1-like isoform X2 [Homalodisca vitripennis]XP_046683303.1 WASH complex subunit 1-like isoform X2 [Homalodisca vitripennis]XP_046683304.1 WASH complex subunit 1-like isoform X2 [Homalodisca vitripennis]